MYNGIGLDTVRGSGTNGYITRNLSSIRHKKDRIDYKNEDQMVKYDFINKEPNQGLIQHERKRKIELKCLEMQELMDEQGYTEKEIDEKVTKFREMLVVKEGLGEPMVDVDEVGRPLNSATHILAAAKKVQDDKVRNAFGISEFYIEGSGMDPERKAKETAARELANSKKYSMLDPSSESSESEEEKPAKVPKSQSKKHRKHKKHSDKEKEKKSKKSRKHKKRSSRKEEDSHSEDMHESSKSTKHSTSRRKHRRTSSERSSESPSANEQKRNRSRSPRTRTSARKRPIIYQREKQPEFSYIDDVISISETDSY